MSRWNQYDNIMTCHVYITPYKAWCGTCQSNAHIAGILAERWEKRYELDLKVFVINKDNER